MSNYYDYNLGPYQVNFLGKICDKGEPLEIVDIGFSHYDSNWENMEQEHKCFYIPASVDEIRRCLHSETDIEKLFQLPEHSKVWIWTELGVTVGSCFGQKLN